jgi:long-chain acyl-CoA synthetase
VSGVLADMRARGASWWARAGRWALSRGQKLIFRHFFRVRVVGAENVPPKGTAFIIASNHTSHLDFAPIKHALGYRPIISLAAKDYFFERPFKRWFFTNFTYMLPFNRKAALKESLQAAGEVLASGMPVLIFPEGTRTTTGRMSPFKASVGYLALNNRVDVLPVYLLGLFEAMPKGAWFPRHRHTTIVVGKPIPHAELAQAAGGREGSDAYKAVTAVIEAEVRRLGGEPAPEPAAR